MGVSTDGQLSYGVVFEEGTEFPWDQEPWNSDIDEWWMDVNGYQYPAEVPYDENGNYKPGISSGCPELKAYYDHRRKWLQDNPVPVELVNYCSGDYPMYVIAVKDYHHSCRRGYPLKVDPLSLVVSPELTAAVKSFIEKWIGSDILESNEPAWWLTSYWG